MFEKYREFNWKPTTKEIFELARNLFLFLPLIGCFWLVLYKYIYTEWNFLILLIFCGIGSLCFVIASISTVLFKPFYLLWNFVIISIDFLLSFISLFIVFYFFISPVSIIFKLTGRDALNIKKSPIVHSYFNDIKTNENVSSYYNQY